MTIISMHNITTTQIDVDTSRMFPIKIETYKSFRNYETSKRCPYMSSLGCDLIESYVRDEIETN